MKDTERGVGACETRWVSVIFIYKRKCFIIIIIYFILETKSLKGLEGGNISVIFI